MPITLNNINEKVRTVEETNRAIPISMGNLDDRITTLEATQQKWKIYTLNHTFSSWRHYFNIPSDVIGWNWVIISGSFVYNERNYLGNLSNGGITSNHLSSPAPVTKSGNQLVSFGGQAEGNYSVTGYERITVLFYK